MCENCPVRNKAGCVCIAERYGAKNLCEHMNPESPQYNYAYAQLIVDKSCDTHNYQMASVTVTEEAEDKSKKHQLPSVWQQLKNVAKATTEHVKDGMRNVSDEEYKKRIDTCNSCEFLNRETKRCMRCGCATQIKARWRTSKCPENKWEIPTE